MAVIAIATEPYADDSRLLPVLAQALGLELVDLRAFERELADHIDIPADKLELKIRQHGRMNLVWTLGAGDLAQRIRELILEAAYGGNVLVAGWSAPIALRDLPHAACVRIGGREHFRARSAQRRLRYPRMDSAWLELASADARIARLVWYLFKAHWRETQHFDLVIDAERMTTAGCMALIRQLAFEKRCRENAATAEAIAQQLAELTR